MLEVVEPVMILEQGHCWLNARSQSTSFRNQQWQGIWEIVSHLQFTHSLHCLLCEADGGFCLKEVVLLIMRQQQFQVKGLLVIFPSISCITVANKHLPAVFQDAAKLHALQLEPSGSVCSLCFLWVCIGCDSGWNDSSSSWKRYKKITSFSAGLAPKLWYV